MFCYSRSNYYLVKYPQIRFHVIFKQIIALFIKHHSNVDFINNIFLYTGIVSSRFLTVFLLGFDCLMYSIFPLYTSMTDYESVCCCTSKGGRLSIDSSIQIQVVLTWSAAELDTISITISFESKLAWYF